MTAKELKVKIKKLAKQVYRQKYYSRHTGRSKPG